ncbi:MAG: nicotinate-nucleotide adenylyltransferase [Mycoplasmatota bacterium]|nr:nicotinate-nucleotide adenylyltransferase [Mycoplasmatota bacterium]
MRIGIFGGSFNPPHKMHYNIGKELIRMGYIDKVIYVPTGSKYIYKDNLVDDSDRYNMLSIMIEDDERFIVSDFELRNRNVYTYETLDYFQKTYPNDEIYFILGTDNLSYIDQWEKGEELLLNKKFLVVKRKTDDINLLLDKYQKYRSNIIVSDVLESDVSSTDIREKLQKKEDVLDFLSEGVYNYILENKLYE